ncbi:MAG TPA: polysaccharide biosynthesis tyrosine autokinase [Roseiflexaceae bacterium]|nr:polysaccharide biosynthesis tyrosine autokinase [Roseiflexaceae bacterium]
MELKNYFAILRRWGWIMLLCTALAGITGYLYTSRQPPVYQSRARYLIGPALDPNVTRSDIQTSSQIGQTYDELSTSRPVLEAVIAKLNLGISPEQLKDQVGATWIDTTQILSIRANAGDPNDAARIANAIGDELIQRSPSNPTSQQALRRQQADAQIARLQDTIRSTDNEIDNLASQVQQTTDPVAQRALIIQLDQRRAQLAAAQRSYNDLLQLLQTTDVNKITLVEAAVPVPDAPIAPDVSRTVLAAVIAGLVLGLVAMILLEYFNDVIYTPEALRKTTGLTYLGGLARHKRLRGSNGAQLVTVAKPETLAAESYRILRTNLQIAGTDRHLPSLLISSPSRGDGKSDVAANLAVVLARAGKLVILIDANLRRPQVASLFGVPDQNGLAQLLESESLPEPVEVASVPGLFVLPAGGVAPNSSEILGSQRMYRLIQEYKARADVVLVDSPPLWYSDALALAPQVDGVLLVVSSGTTGRENTLNAVESLRLVGARIIGTVLNRVKAGPAYFYYPTYAANRMALDSSGSVAAISAGAAPRALAAAPQAPAAPDVADSAGETSAPAISGGLVEPTDQFGTSARDAGHAAPESSAPGSPYATAFIDALTPDMSAAPDARVGMAGEGATATDDSDLGHAIGEAVAAYKSDDQMLNSNGHSSASQRRGKHR